MPFVPGLRLCREFYREVVAPLLAAHFPERTHSAALLGPGSEVLGFDSERSTDHDWAPRVLIFTERPEGIREMLAERLPARFRGYPTNLAPAGDAQRMQPTDGPVNHRVHASRLGDWLHGQLGFDPRAGIGTSDWLRTPTQALAEVTAGEVFHDGVGELEPVRRALSWYPDDVWRYVLACQWQRIRQEEAFVGRAGEVGDELGSAVVAARLVRDLMRLCLLLRQRYPLYGKWLGSGFALLPDAGELTPMLTGALAARDWREREAWLGRAYETIAGLHNASGLTVPVDARTRRYHDRPFRVLHAERFVEALRASIADESVRALPLRGAVDQFVDNTDVLAHPAELRRMFGDDR